MATEMARRWASCTATLDSIGLVVWQGGGRCGGSFEHVFHGTKTTIPPPGHHRGRGLSRQKLDRVLPVALDFFHLRHFLGCGAQGNSKPWRPKPARPPDPMQVGLAVWRTVFAPDRQGHIDHHGARWDVHTPGEHVGGAEELDFA